MSIEIFFFFIIAHLDQCINFTRFFFHETYYLTCSMISTDIDSINFYSSLNAGIKNCVSQQFKTLYRSTKIKKKTIITQKLILKLLYSTCILN